MTTLKIISPVAIVESMVVSTSLGETEYAAHSGGTAYVIGDRAISDHRVWECAVANTGHTPEDGDADGSGVLYWDEVGPTNAYAMFDSLATTQSENAGSITFTVAPGTPCNALALIAAEGTSADIEITDGLGGPVLYTGTLSLDGSVIGDWLDYFFEDFAPVGEVALTNLPMYGSAHYSVTLNGAQTAIGVFVLGRSADYGRVQGSPSVGIIDYSIKDVNGFGQPTFVVRGFAKRMNLNLVLDTTDVARVEKRLAALRATPAVYIASASMSPLIVFGWYRDFSLTVAYPTHSLCALEVEGLTQS